ncbi:MAG: CoA-transferase [Bryobacteraceae bacterium]
MPDLVNLDELAERVPDGARLGIGGVHLSRLPIALIQKIAALGRNEFTFISWGGGLALELLLEARAVRKLVFCFSSLDIFGLAPRFREALEKNAIDVEEWSALAMIQALHAAHFNLPEMPFQLPHGSDLMSAGEFWMQGRSSFTKQPVGLAKRLDIDVLLLHAQRADTAGNIEIQGARGFDLSLLGATGQTLVTVEKVVKTGELGAPLSFVLPKTFVDAVAAVPGGAYPTSCLPYYSTDYEELLRYVQTGQSRFTFNEPRKMFLGHAAQIRTADLTTDRIEPHRIPISSDASFTTDELLAVCLAREYDNSSICSVGSVSPLAMVSYLLAKATHAPELIIIALNGGLIDIDAHPMSLTLAEPLEFGSAKVIWGADESYHWYYQQGRITHEVITVAQLDVRGRTNNAWVDTGRKRIRLPGQGGMADVANLHQHFVLYLTRHSRERFVESVQFCTAARGLMSDSERIKAGLKPGQVRLISDLGIFEINPADGIFRLISLHPNVTLEMVKDNPGGQFLVADPLPATNPPGQEQLRLIRSRIDPFGIRRLEFVPGRERLNLIESILKAEAGLVNDLPKKEK